MLLKIIASLALVFQAFDTTHSPTTQNGCVESIYDLGDGRTGVGVTTGLVLNEGGYPVYAYGNITDNLFYLRNCLDSSCSNAVETKLEDQVCGDTICACAIDRFGDYLGIIYNLKSSPRSVKYRFCTLSSSCSNGVTTTLQSPITTWAPAGAFNENGNFIGVWFLGSPAHVNVANISCDLNSGCSVDVLKGFSHTTALRGVKVHLVNSTLPLMAYLDGSGNMGYYACLDVACSQLSHVLLTSNALPNSYVDFRLTSVGQRPIFCFLSSSLSLTVAVGNETYPTNETTTFVDLVDSVYECGIGLKKGGGFVIQGLGGVFDAWQYRCDDYLCSGGVESSLIDSNGQVGYGNYVKVDEDGNIFTIYADVLSGKIKLYTCIYPTQAPTVSPTRLPTVSPSLTPSASPSLMPTEIPTVLPTTAPTSSPTLLTVPPSVSPTQVPSTPPTYSPSRTPTQTPTFLTQKPTQTPSGLPSTSPSQMPTGIPTLTPTALPTALPSVSTKSPTKTPSGVPSLAPTYVPTLNPSATPTRASVPPTVVSTSPTAKEEEEVMQGRGARVATYVSVSLGVVLLVVCTAFLTVYCIKREKNKKISSQVSSLGSDSAPVAADLGYNANVRPWPKDQALPETEEGFRSSSVQEKNDKIIASVYQKNQHDLGALTAGHIELAEFETGAKHRGENDLLSWLRKIGLEKYYGAIEGEGGFENKLDLFLEADLSQIEKLCQQVSMKIGEISKLKLAFKEAKSV